MIHPSNTLTGSSLTIREFCEYWRDGNEQYLEDKLDTDLLRSDLAEASRLLTDLYDTVKACLVAAGGSTDDEVLEAQCRAAGDKPSDFVRAMSAPLLIRIAEWNQDGRSGFSMPVVDSRTIVEIETILNAKP